MPAEDVTTIPGLASHTAAAAWLTSALDLRAAYRRGELSPVNVVDTLGARIAQLDPDFNACAALCLERAAQEAWEATGAYDAGKPRPLEGIPFLVKDIVDTAGVTTTYGSALFRDHVPAADAVAVARLRKAGAILLGKTVTHEFAWGVTTVNPHYGATRNPWDPERVVGGSSGGSAAAVAAHLAPLALGTDTGGSVRTPAAFCGVVGLKPTFGAVPTEGVFPLAATLDHVGTLTRTPEDAALMLSALTGRTHAPTPCDALRGLRVGYVDAADPDVAAVLSALARLDAVPVEVELPAVDDQLAAFFDIQRAEVARVHLTKGLFPSRRLEYGRDVADRLERARSVGLPAYLTAAVARERIRAGALAVLAEVDCVALPIAPMTPPTVASVLEHGDETVRQRIMPTTVLANLTGLPAVAVRTRFDEAGMPRAAQIVGPPFAEERLLGLARTMRSAHADVWARRPPERT
ncbi:MAG: amidase [Conexibacter sp.]